LQRTLVVQALPLDEGWPGDVLAERWGDKLAERLLFHAAWVRLPEVVEDTHVYDAASYMVNVDDQTEHGQRRRFVEVIADWLRGEQRVLHILSDESPDLPDLCRTVLAYTDSPEVVGCVVSNTRLQNDLLEQLIQQFLIAAGSKADKDDRASQLVERLVAQRELVPIIVVNQQSMPAPEILRLVGNEGRAIVIAPTSWRFGGVDGPELPSSIVLRIKMEPAEPKA
jgi:hypothetical protein